MKEIDLLTQNSKTATLNFFLVVGLLYILNPLCGIFACIFRILMLKDEVPSYVYHILFFLLACWLGCINMTKLPTGDLPGYIRQFKRVPSAGFYGTIFEAFGGSGKEPFYSFFTFIGYYLCGGKASLYFFALVTVMYYLLFAATYKLFVKVNAGKEELLCGIFSLAFFTQYFVLTTHLVRQMLSMSIMMYAIIDGIVKGKRNCFLAIVAVLTHTSSILLFFFSLIPWIYTKMSLRRIIILLACFVPIIIFNTQIGHFLGSTNLQIETLQYAASRYGSNASDGLYVPISLMMMVFAPLGIVAFKTLWTLRHEKDCVLYPIIYMYLMLMLLVVMFTQNPLLQYRYFYYTYAFIPFILPLLFYHGNRNLDHVYCTVVCVFFIIRFFLIHNTSGMQFAPVSTISFMPFPYYFLESFYY